MTATMRPPVVELAGLAGAGKSSIAQALVRLDAGIRARPRVPWWRHVASVPPLLPTFVSLHWPFRGVLGKEMKRALRLRALEHIVAEATGRVGPRGPRCSMLVFDEGPVYFLARTLVFGGAKIETPAFWRWWRHAISRWAVRLDAIVWLDAPDEVLAARLRARPVHPFGDVDDECVSAMLEAYRDAYSRVIGELTAAGGPRLWTLPTERQSPDRTARQLLAELREPREAGSRVRETA